MSWDKITNRILEVLIILLLILSIVFISVYTLVLINRDAFAETKRYTITTKDRVRVGDIYDPGAGRRLQIRNKSRQIIGYIAPNGTITDKWRRKQGGIQIEGVTVK
jgi:hypothetical protein